MTTDRTNRRPPPAAAAPRRRSPRIAALAAMVALLAAGHFTLATLTHEQHIGHTIMAAAFLLPITASAVWFGLRGAFITILAVCAVFVPHILTDWRGNRMENTNQYTLLAVNCVAGLTSGVLVNLQQRERARKLEAERRALRSALVTGIATLSAALGARDGYTLAHSEHVSVLATAIARAMGYSGERLEVVRLAGLVHDVGKIGVRDDILFKPDRLTPDERAAMREHPDLAAEILGAIPESGHLAEIVRAHHEAPDGSGYPRGLKLDQIPQEARIVGVADVFSALTGARPYKEGMTAEQALGVMDGMAGRTLDLACYRALKDVVAQGKPPQFSGPPREGWTP